jgi:hypothetical protein
MPIQTITIGHDCEDLCTNCNGSGEGMHDGTRCSTCGGSGNSVYNGYVEKEFEVKWTEADFSDLEILDGPSYRCCEDCDFDYEEEILNTLKEKAWLASGSTSKESLRTQKLVGNL